MKDFLWNLCSTFRKICFNSKIVYIVLSGLAFPSYAQEIISFGHLYPFLKDTAGHSQIKEQLEPKMREAEFIVDLGDETQPWIEQQRRNFPEKYSLAPGNHDLPHLDVDLEPTLTFFPAGNFLVVTINSSAHIDSINQELMHHHKKLSQAPLLLFTHHRIWDDNQISPHPFGHDKSYFSNEIRLDGLDIKAVFAGNSCAQYMPNNTKYLSWIDDWNGIPCYNIGSGHAQQKGITVASIELDDFEFIVCLEKLPVDVQLVPAPEKTTKPIPEQEMQVESTKSFSMAFSFLYGLISGGVFIGLIWGYQAKSTR